MIDIHLIRKFCNINKQLENCFKKFITQIIKDNGYSKKITVYFVQIQIDVNEISIFVGFDFGNEATEVAFFIDPGTSRNVENILREQIEEYLNDVMEDEDYD